MASSKSKGRGVGQSHLRIIGGQWRSRKLAFTPAEGLRPTSDRIRETLFNWLAPAIVGARCADLFAGSGALGLEALSRGALHCDFVDHSPVAVRDIAGHLAALNAREAGSCHQCTAEQYLHGAGAPLDIVFLDPPFGRNLLSPCTGQLTASGLLRAGALVYIESPADERLGLPTSWTTHRHKRAGGVSYGLWEITST